VVYVSKKTLISLIRLFVNVYSRALTISISSVLKILKLAPREAS
jgi:hypothetical protein